MPARRWCFGVTVVVAAIGTGGSPAVAQHSPPAIELPKVEVPAVTVPPVDVPVPQGVPEVSTPAISTPPVSTPAVQTPAIATPVGTVPSVSVPAVKVAPVTISPVRTVPDSRGGAPATGGGAGASTPAGEAAGHDERRATPALAVRGASARHDRAKQAPATATPAGPASDTAETADRRPADRATSRSAAAPIVGSRVDRRTVTQAVQTRHGAPVALPAENVADKRAPAARPLIDGLGDAFDLAPLLMASGLAGVLCAVSVRRRQTR
jgi:hypothetical protein